MAEPLAPLPRQRLSLRDFAYETLKRQIIETELAPGLRLFERDIAADLQVSRIPLREALRRLETDGLVLVVPGKGALVAPFTPADVRELFDVRETLEPLAARLTAARGDEADLGALRQRLRAIELATKHGSPQRLAEANADFHAEVFRLAGNPLLAHTLKPVEVQIRRLFHLTAGCDPIDQCAEHELLYETIASGDPDKAAGCALHHVSSLREPCLRMAETWNIPDIDLDQVARMRRRKRKSES